MKILITSFIAVLTLILSQPVLASDVPAGGPQGQQAAQVATGSSDVVTWVLLAFLAAGALVIIALVLRNKNTKLDKQREERLTSNAKEIARISSTLLVALIALVTFLLVVGVQNSIQGFTTELYTALILLGTGLVIYAVANVIREAAIMGGAIAFKGLNILRSLQQLVFIGSILAVVWFVISYAQLFIKPPTPPPAPTQQQTQSTEPQPGQQAPPQPSPAQP